jgi:uncharacterized protein
MEVAAMKMTVLALAAALVLVAPAATAQPAAPSAQPVPLFLFMYRPGPAWEAGKPMQQQKLGPHGAYMRKLTAEGRVVAGGPWLDVDGGMGIVRAASLDEAKAVLAADPAITSGVFTAEIRTWQLMVDSGKPLRP